MSTEAPKKILIVGESLTGKTSLIRAFLEFDGQNIKTPAHQLESQQSQSTNAATIQNNNNSCSDNRSIEQQQTAPFILSPHMSSEAGYKHKLSLAQPKNNNFGSAVKMIQNDESPVPKQLRKLKTQSSLSSNTDFSMKFLKIDGRKHRLQLWDQGSSANPKTIFQPLFTRHVSGCIVVANTSNPRSITKAAKWKEQFDKMTKVQDEPSIPCTLFINHDIKDERTQSLNLNQSDCLLRDQENPSDKLSHQINYEKMIEFETLAKKEINGYFGIYHISIGQPDTIYDSFENFVSRMIEENEYAQRTFTIGSTFFDDFTIKTNNINEGTGTFSEHGQFKGPSNRVGIYQYESDYSFKLRRLSDRRQDRNSYGQNNTCC